MLDLERNNTAIQLKSKLLKKRPGCLCEFFA